MDRFIEFKGVAEMMARQRGSQLGHFQREIVTKAATNTFYRLAKQLQADIALSSEKMEKLTLLCSMRTGEH